MILIWLVVAAVLFGICTKLHDDMNTEDDKNVIVGMWFVAEAVWTAYMLTRWLWGWE